MSNRDDSRLATPEEVAEYLQIPLPTLYTWRARAVRLRKPHLRGPVAITVGRHLRYRWSDVDAWVDDQTDDQREIQAQIAD
jgi:predicted DNA-binding transcriptional regulator AlpA